MILRAVSLLKKTINELWISTPVEVDKENVPQNQGAVKAQMTPEIAESDKMSVRNDIISAMEVAVGQLESKKVSAELENVLYNLTQTDFADGHLTPILNQIEQHLLNDSDARCWLVGLRALREVVRGLQDELDESRKPLYQLMDRFLPMLERILQISASNECPTQLETMILILKIFHLANYHQLLPVMMQMDRLTPWIEFMVNILDVRLADTDLRQK